MVSAEQGAAGIVIGILALQGDFEMHRRAFSAIGIPAREVRIAEDLSGLSGLIVPGGESTTMTLLLEAGLRAPILDFCRNHPVWGTCAGMIMLAKESRDPRVKPLGLMDITVDRNGFGRQVHSFEADLRVADEVGAAETPLHGVFIRAPRIISFEKTVQPLIWLNDEPVAVRQGNYLASSFHPELTRDDRLQRYFAAMMR